MDLASRDVAATVLDLANLDQGCLVIARTQPDRPRCEQNTPSPTLSCRSRVGLIGRSRKPRFVKLVADEQVVRVVEVETADPVLRGEMTFTTKLRDADGGTEVIGRRACRAAWRRPTTRSAGALDRLAALPRSQPWP
jgi:hypothetical protein